MDLTFATRIELDVSRNLLDAGARLFLLEHAPPAETGYKQIKAGSPDNIEIHAGWFLQRNKFAQWILEIAYTDELTPAVVTRAAAILYTGLYEPDGAIIFEVRDADYARSASDRTGFYRLDLLQTIKEFDL